MTFDPPVAPRLDTLDPDTFISGSQLAALCGVSPLTVRSWRQQGKGPAWVKLNHITVRYRVRDVQAWLSRLPKRVPSSVDFVALRGDARQPQAETPKQDRAVTSAFEELFGAPSALLQGCAPPEDLRPFIHTSVLEDDYSGMGRAPAE